MTKYKKLLWVVCLIIAIFIGLVFILQKILTPNIAVPDIVVKSDEKLIKRGNYLANHVAVCMDCHSTRDWTRFSGPIEEGTLGKGGEYFGPEMGFPGTFYSKNITNWALDSWTDGEIFRAITSGVSKDGGALFPVMPYHYYSTMDRTDVYAIIAYLRTLPSIESDIPKAKADFPINFIMKTFPVAYRPNERPSADDRVAFGAYLVNAASCMDCHSPFRGGEVVVEEAFSGGRSFAMPSGMLYSANITPEIETGIGQWTDSTFVARFKAYEDWSLLPLVKAEQVNTVMPWNMYAGMTRSDLEAIYAFLQTLKPIYNKVERYKNIE